MIKFLTGMMVVATLAVMWLWVEGIKEEMIQGYLANIGVAGAMVSFYFLGKIPVTEAS